MLCLSGFDLYFRWVPLLNGGDRLIEGDCMLNTVPLKVIPLKLFYYQTFFGTWHNQHS